MASKTLKASQPAMFKLTDFWGDSNTLTLLGLPVNHKPSKDSWTVTLMDVPFDSTWIEITLGHGGEYRTGLRVRNSSKNAVQVTAGNFQEETKAYTAEYNIAGDITVTWTTNCGNPAKDVTVRIRIFPDHEKLTADISYTVSRAA